MLRVIHGTYIHQEYQEAMDILSVASAKQKHDQLREIQETLAAELSELSKLSEAKQVPWGVPWVPWVRTRIQKRSNGWNETYGIFWNLMESHGILWNLMESYGYFWILMESYGYLWILIVMYKWCICDVLYKYIIISCTGWCVDVTDVDHKVKQSSSSSFGSDWGTWISYMGLSENSVPLHPMVNDHYPY